MAYRPAQIYTGSGWDDIGDPRVGTVQTDVTNLQNGKLAYETPLTDQSGTTYTFALADARRITRATNASAKTFTIPPQTSVTWANNTIIRVVNSGAGALTVNGGSGVTVTNTASTIGQFESAAAIRTGSNAWTLVPFGSKAKPPSSVNCLAVGGGGGGQQGVDNLYYGGGAGGGGSRNVSFNPVAGTVYTVTVGGGGGNNSNGTNSTISGSGLTTITGGGGSTPATGAGSGAGGSGTSTGGAGGAGGDPGAAGSAGPANSISGTSTNYGGGGGGSRGASGGAGGGGAGGNLGVPGSPGAGNTGGGGGGGDPFNSRVGGSGGSGIIFIEQSNAFKAAVVTGEPAIITINNNIIYVFRASGTIQWTA